jgi:hypothetical protein
MPDIKDVLAVVSQSGNRRRATARICLRQDLVGQHIEKDAELQRLTQEFGEGVLKPQTIRDLATEITALEAEIETNTVEFVFESRQDREWTQLVAAHPPTKKQLDANKNADHNPDKFRPAAIAAACVDPAMTVDDATQMRELLHPASFEHLWQTCRMLHLGGDNPKSMLAGLILRRNGASGTTAVPAGYLEASSSGE